MGKIVFITGGARSGKSAFAEDMLKGEDDVLYIATAAALDSEMEDRISRHRERRNEKWSTLEAYKDLDLSIREVIAGKKFILFDCVTIMVSNIMTLDNSIDWGNSDSETINSVEKSITEEVSRLIAAAESFQGETIIVSNELGMGIVPENPLVRIYRDIAGRINQYIASQADEVFLVVSGIPMKIKG